MMNFHILTQSLVDIVIPTQKISFPKMFDFHGNSHTAYVSLTTDPFKIPTEKGYIPDGWKLALTRSPMHNHLQ